MKILPGLEDKLLLWPAMNTAGRIWRTPFARDATIWGVPTWLSLRACCPHCKHVGEATILRATGIRGMFTAPRCARDSCAAARLPPERTLAMPTSGSLGSDE